MSKTAKIFISYSWSTKEIAEKIYHDLTLVGLDILKDDSAWDKTLPVVYSETNIYTALDRINYINYWETLTRKISDAVKTIDPVNATEIYKELKQHLDITAPHIIKILNVYICRYIYL